MTSENSSEATIDIVAAMGTSAAPRELVTSTTKRWMTRTGQALLMAAVAIGCAAPSIGLEPSLSRDTTKGDDDDDSAAPTATTSSAVTPAPTTVSSVDAGADADAAPAVVPCTESGAVQSQGHCYFALTTAASWDDSKTACAAVGAHLATLTTAAEETVGEALDSGDERWIGLRRPTGSAATDASYVWLTAEPRAFADWDTTKSEPDGSCPTCSSGQTAECTRVLTTGGWADDSCAVQHRALCERE